MAHFVAEHPELAHEVWRSDIGRECVIIYEVATEGQSRARALRHNRVSLACAFTRAFKPKLAVIFVTMKVGLGQRSRTHKDWLGSLRPIIVAA